MVDESSLTARVLSLFAGVGDDSDRLGAWIGRHPVMVAALFAAAVLLAGAVDGGAI